MALWDKLIERQINKAQSKGQLKNLKGEGKPLPRRPEAALIDPADAVGFRIMAESGALPREIELQKEIKQLQDEVIVTETEAGKKEVMKRLSELQTRHAIEKEARIKMVS
ncbi:DUF1992 domain-containing protein [Pseudovibrio sp. Tun.PSC04-5.I4]|uniref:DnaJ family domain-containing protein n=1 Tax=Pseudovibrio sp. Tun.PSC04-5.I4 TaxID=1798213 RepID=UPI00088A8EEA|nr:DUF1992 domain-containing protein [Pseudovibrio sp. Tun.PSC04-5.I4]SDR26105.1 protein of unknown function [Pseudovibrio sp. Tun.PSC04-5.I4]